MTPVYRFGDTPTGVNGPIVGAPLTQSVTPTVILFDKANSAPEGERPPGPSWPITYTLSANVANAQTVFALRFGTRSRAACSSTAASSSPAAPVAWRPRRRPS